jgi:transcriptional regulator with XRE-family HTH domain
MEAAMKADRDLAWQVGSTIRRMRLERRLPKFALADLAGVARQTISALENGQYLPSLLTLLKLLGALGYSWGEFGEMLTPDARRRS